MRKLALVLMLSGTGMVAFSLPDDVTYARQSSMGHENSIKAAEHSDQETTPSLKEILKVAKEKTKHLEEQGVHINQGMDEEDLEKFGLTKTHKPNLSSHADDFKKGVDMDG